jgi:hypothetical protein
MICATLMENGIDCQTNQSIFMDEYPNQEECLRAGRFMNLKGFECGYRCESRGIMVCEKICNSASYCGE